MTNLQEIDEKMTKIHDMVGTLEDCPEAFMAEMRIDIDAVQDQIANISEMVQSQKDQAYNYKLGITILSVLVFTLYVIR